MRCHSGYPTLVRRRTAWQNGESLWCGLDSSGANDLSKYVPWPRILAEGLVIVVSVLVALGADAWWDGRQDRREEWSRLSAVRVELGDAYASYGDLLATIAARTDRIAEVLAQTNDYDGNEHRLDSLFFRLGPLTDPTPPTVALDDAISAGALGLIESAEMRRALARYHAAVERVQGEAEVIRGRFERELPLGYEFINLRRQMATSPSEAFDVGLPDIPLPPRYEELLANRRFVNQMVGHAALLARLRLRAEEAMTAADALVGLLEQDGHGSGE